MTKRNQGWHRWAKLSLAAAVSATIATPSYGFQFYLGEIEGSLDTTLKAGASWRIEDRDKDQLSQGSQGLGPGTTGSSTVNTDDGNWNFDKGETYSKRISGTTDLLLRYEDFGGFTRLRYFYDKELMDESRARDTFGNTRELTRQGREQAGADVRFMDAYIWGDFYIGDDEIPLNLRFGKQVISWGESTFVFGGINSVNPVDFAAVRAPGAEVKDVLIPVNMLYGSLGITEDLTIEAFYQLEWKPVELDPCGTFFSNLDAAAPGCGPIYAGNAPEPLLDQQGLYASRIADDEPDNEGMFGLALRWYAANLGDTEFGFYYTRTHSLIPSVNFIKTREDDPFSSQYYLVYPEDIDMFGISFNTNTDGGWSIGGEISYRPSFPVSHNGFEMTAASIDRDYSAFWSEGGYGELIQGYEEFPITQAQVTFVKFFDQILGASRLTFVSEVAGTYIHDFVEDSRFGRDSTFGVGPVITDSDSQCTEPAVNNNPKFCEDDGFVTEFSAGYRIRAGLDYNDVIAGINLSPVLFWSHDVVGWGPVLMREGAQSIGLTLNASYLNRYNASVGYTAFFGGEPYNFLNDRDNVSVSVSTSF